MGDWGAGLDALESGDGEVALGDEEEELSAEELSGEEDEMDMLGEEGWEASLGLSVDS